MSEYKAQENDLIYALDIGTRSVIGMVGQTDGDRFKVLDVEAAEHKKRAMIDGQIDNIRQVAEVVRQVTQRLEERLNVSLERVCVAAAGRALQTKAGTFSLSLPENNVITVEQVSQLVAAHTQKPLVSFIGMPVVNIVELNLALDALRKN